MVETVGIHQVMWFVMLKSAKETGVFTCPVWNGLLTNYGCCGKCALL
jgi:hypothetical protein